MQNETRVNLKHLLEDMRDSYVAPLEEVILTELIANALDSKSTRIDFILNKTEHFLRCVDNGVGMRRAAIKEYHNIAASEKIRGEGIGFAGVGAKLSLLLAEKVVTESKGGRGSRAATEWRLINPYRAPWKFIPTSEAVKYSRGTSITLHFSDEQSHLLREDFVANSINKHFYPLFHDYIKLEILRFVYRKGIEITVNCELLTLPEAEQRIDHAFRVFLGKSQKPVGAGFLTKKVLAQGFLARFASQVPEKHQVASGLSVSTYGKIIKTGWEWLGIIPKNAESLCGVVEIPGLSELLTTSKSDFLGDASHLKKFYRLRKAIQRAVLPILRSLGEYAEASRTNISKNIKPLERQIESTLEQLAHEFPELETLLGSRRQTGMGAKTDRLKNGARKENKNESELAQYFKNKIEDKIKKKIKRSNVEGKTWLNKSGLTLSLEELSDAPEILGHMIEDVVSVNTLHSAWKKALATKQEEYHILMVVGLILADYVAPDKHPLDFLAKFLSSWSTIETAEDENGQPKLI